MAAQDSTAASGAEGPDAAAVVRDLDRSFGDVRALDGVSFTVETGEIFGLVGPNGAGKTTTLRILSTLLDRDGGTVSVFGRDVAEAPTTVRSSVRYLPAEAGAYENMTGRQYLEFIAGFFADDPAAHVDRGVEIADLGDRLDDDTSEYSTGMTRKLLVAATLMTRPRLAILDEVTTGLDVRNARRVREIIEAYPGPERAVLLSSHDMLEVSYLCDRVAFLSDGAVVDVGTPDDLCERYDAENLEGSFLEATR